MADRFRHRAGSLLFGVRLLGHDAFERESDPSLLARFADWIDSKMFLNFVRDITDERSIQHASAQAMRFTTGHFSSVHTDATKSDHQCATCVFSMTPTWQRSWGGLLQFANKHGNIDDAFVPYFNSMTVFKSSLRHAVSVVTRQAQMPRYSIAASLLADQQGRGANVPSVQTREVSG
jgi:Rps23 Pro-64 3,4-dihydroxylase Tpa1-like proline 4-hydroxylase